MSYDQCQFCGDIAFKTNGNSESICLSRANSGQCKKDKEQLKSEKPSRNQPCPCGSGKKYKRCCGKAVIPDFKHTPPAPPPGSLCNVTLSKIDIKCAE